MSSLAFFCLCTASFLFLGLPELSWIFPGVFLMGLGGSLAFERIASSLESLKEDLFVSSLSSFSSSSYKPNSQKQNKVPKSSFKKTKQFQAPCFWIKKGTDNLLVLESTKGSVAYWVWLFALVLFFLLWSSFLFYNFFYAEINQDFMVHPVFFSALVILFLSMYFMGIGVYFFRNKFKERILFFLKDKVFQIQNSFSLEPEILDFSLIERISVVQRENSNRKEIFYQRFYEVFLEFSLPYDVSEFPYRFSDNSFSYGDSDPEIKKKNQVQKKFLARFFNEESLYSFLEVLVISLPVSVHFSNEVSMAKPMLIRFSEKFKSLKHASPLTENLAEKSKTSSNTSSNAFSKDSLWIQYDNLNFLPSKEIQTNGSLQTKTEEKTKGICFRWKKKESFSVSSFQFFLVLMSLVFCLYSYLFFPSVFWIFVVFSAFFLYVFCNRYFAFESLLFSSEGIEYRSQIARLTDSKKFFRWQEIKKVYFLTEDLLLERKFQPENHNQKNKRNHQRSNRSVLFDVYGLGFSEMMLLKEHFLEYLPRHRLKDHSLRG